jgi:hypothetical protein
MALRQRIQLPSGPQDAELYHEALQSDLAGYRWILDQEENWDGEEVAQVEATTFARAIRFIADHAVALYEHTGFQLDPPRLSVGPNGSIDVHWEYPDREMAVNFAPLASAPVTYYFRNDAGARSRGSDIRNDPPSNVLSVLIA